MDNLTIEKLKNLAETFVGENTKFISCEYDGFMGDISGQDYEGNEFFIDSGASKIVLILEDIFNKVIKIPITQFEFSNSTEYCCEASDEQLKEADCCGERYNCIYCDCPHFNEDNQYCVEDFCGANSSNGDDYCEAETKVYQWAIDENLEEFFAKTEYLFTTKTGVKIYIQDKVENPDSYSFNREVSEETKEKYKEITSTNNNARILTSDFAKVIIEHYGVEKFVDLINFIGKYGLSDFHSTNVGYDKEGKPIIFDYSGFYS